MPLPCPACLSALTPHLQWYGHHLRLPVVTGIGSGSGPVGQWQHMGQAGVLTSMLALSPSVLALLPVELV